MWLSRIEPDEPNHDKRTFECPQCENVVELRAASALRIMLP
jgi:hypothetical protein